MPAGSLEAAIKFGPWIIFALSFISTIPKIYAIWEKERTKRHKIDTDYKLAIEKIRNGQTVARKPKAIPEKLRSADK